MNKILNSTFDINLKGTNINQERKNTTAISIPYCYFFFFFKQICTAKESVITNHTIQQSRATLILYTAEQKHSHIRMLRVRQLYWWTPNRFYLQRTFCCGEKKKNLLKFPLWFPVFLLYKILQWFYIYLHRLAQLENGYKLQSGLAIFFFFKYMIWNIADLQSMVVVVIHPTFQRSAQMKFSSHAAPA